MLDLDGHAVEVRRREARRHAGIETFTVVDGQDVAVDELRGGVLRQITGLCTPAPSARVSVLALLLSLRRSPESDQRLGKLFRGYVIDRNGPPAVSAALDLHRGWSRRVRYV